MNFQRNCKSCFLLYLPLKISQSDCNQTASKIFLSHYKKILSFPADFFVELFKTKKQSSKKSDLVGMAQIWSNSSKVYTTGTKMSYNNSESATVGNFEVDSNSGQVSSLDSFNWWKEFLGSTVFRTHANEKYSKSFKSFALTTNGLQLKVVKHFCATSFRFVNKIDSFFFHFKSLFQQIEICLH